ncbi:MAG TPA: hypothetical protein PLN52_05375 [Opitutaceae bacterium]|nr:hypothetical protein [Opitutaceae bacterium]
MTTFLKVLVVALLVLVAIKLWPLIALVLGFIGCLLMAVGGGLLGGISALAAGAIAILAVVVSVGFTALVLLSPIWIPLLMVLGVIALCRRLART